jgi:hypothetical protein
MIAKGKDQAMSVMGELQPWLHIRKPYQFTELMELLRKASKPRPEQAGSSEW